MSFPRLPLSSASRADVKVRMASEQVVPTEKPRARNRRLLRLVRAPRGMTSTHLPFQSRSRSSLCDPPRGNYRSVTCVQFEQASYKLHNSTTHSLHQINTTLPILASRTSKHTSKTCRCFLIRPNRIRQTLPVGFLVLERQETAS